MSMSFADRVRVAHHPMPELAAYASTMANVARNARERPSIPSRPRAPSPATGFQWKGVLVGRTFPGDMPASEYLLLLAGGSRRHRDHPDARDHAGRPIYILSARQRRERERLFDRLCLDRVETRNVACNAGRGNLLNFLIGTAGYTGVTWFAVGTGAGTPTSTDAQLFTEFFRKQPSAFSISGNQALISTNFAAAEAVGTYTEAGIFGTAPVGASGGASGGNTASATANTGMLFAHTNYAFTKANGVLLGNNYTVFFN